MGYATPCRALTEGFFEVRECNRAAESPNGNVGAGIGKSPLGTTVSAVFCFGSRIPTSLFTLGIHSARKPNGFVYVGVTTPFSTDTLEKAYARSNLRSSIVGLVLK